MGEGDFAQELFEVTEGAGVGDGAEEELDGGVGEDRAGGVGSVAFA
jgi:hypothetical protein